MVSGSFVMKWSILRHSISLFCHEMVKPQGELFENYIKLFQPCMYGKYRLSEFLMPKIATLVNIRFNSIQYFNGNSTVYWRDPFNIKRRYIT